MKKALKITGIILGVILVIMISVPFFLSGKIEGIVKKEANSMLNAEFDFASLDISLFKNFPKASISLKDFWIKGQGDFAQDTLATAKELTATVNIISLFKNDGYEIDQILLNEAKIKAVILDNGKENWDILKEEESKEEVTDSGEESEFALKMKKLSIDNLSVIYDNKKDNQYAKVDQLVLAIKGDLTSKQTKLAIEGKTPNLTYQSGGVPLVNSIQLKAKVNIDADLENQVFTLEKNEIQFNAIKTNLDGWIALKEHEAIEMDLKLNANEVGFKEILSLIPAIYSNNFKDIQTDGIASLSAYAKGTMQDENLPSFDITLDVKNAMFRYPSLPSSVDQIIVHANISNPGGHADKTVINLNPFTFRMAGNPFSIAGTIATPMSDPRFNIKANGIIDLGKIKDVYPLEDTELNGLVNADIAIAGQSSFIEKEQYDKLKSSGTIKLSNMIVEGKELAKMTIDQSLLTFTPQHLKLSETTVRIGDNDITFDSQLNNYLGYLMKGSTIRGSMNMRSNHLNLNEFTSTDDNAAEVENDSIFGVVEVPRNIDLAINANLKEVQLSTFTLTDVNGYIQVKNGKADMRNLSMNTMGGEIMMNGYYSTEQMEHPTINANFIMNDIAFSQAYKDLNMVQSLAPIFNALEGSFSGAMQLKSELNEHMEPIYPTLQAAGNLKTKDLSLAKVEAVQQLAKALKHDQLASKPIKDLDVSFVIKDGRLETKPFSFNMGEYNLSLAGTTGLDQTIDYTGKVKLPASVSKIEGLNTLGVIIGGTFNKPTFKVDTKSMIEEGGKILEEKATDLITKELFKQKKDSTSINDTVQKDLKEQVKDVATDKLKDLFKKKKNK